MGVVLRLFRRKPDVSSFDPRERTVREVLAHLRENPDDKTRVQELEKLDKARKTILAK